MTTDVNLRRALFSASRNPTLGYSHREPQQHNSRATRPQTRALEGARTLVAGVRVQYTLEAIGDGGADGLVAVTRPWPNKETVITKSLHSESGLA